MVSYNTGSSYPILNRRKTSLGDKSPGDLLDWSNVNPESSGSNRRYAIRAVVKKGMSISHRVMDKLLKKRGGGEIKQNLAKYQFVEETLILIMKCHTDYFVMYVQINMTKVLKVLYIESTFFVLVYLFTRISHFCSFDYF